MKVILTAFDGILKSAIIEYPVNFSMTVELAVPIGMDILSSEDPLESWPAIKKATFRYTGKKLEDCPLKPLIFELNMESLNDSH